MRPHSIFEFDCVCGEHIITKDAETVCPACGREIEIDWQGETAGDTGERA
jgi:hypothetical protein